MHGLSVGVFSVVWPAPIHVATASAIVCPTEERGWPQETKVCYVCSSSPQLSSPSSSSPANRVLLSSSSFLNPLTRLSNQRHTNQWRHCLCCLCWPTSGWDTSLPFTPNPTDVFPHACCTLTCTPSSTCCTISHSVLSELTCTMDLYSDLACIELVNS